MKFNKNICKHIIAILVIILTLSALAYYSYDELLNSYEINNYIPGTKIGNNLTEALKKGDILEQEFISPASGIYGAGINTKELNGQIILGRFTIEILDGNSGNLLFEKELSGYELNNSGYSYLNFKHKIKCDEGQKLIFKLKVDDISQDNLLVVNLSDKNVYNDINLSVNGEDVSSDMDLSLMYKPNDSVKKMVILIEIIMAVFIIALYVLLIIVKIQPVKLFIPVVGLMAFIYMILIIPKSVPDEQTHELASYNVSNELMGVKSLTEKGYVRIRECDLEYAKTISTEPDRTEYNYFYSNIFTRVGNQKMAATNVKPYEAPKFLYIFSAAGITVGRLMGMDAVFTLSLGRLFNLIFFLALTYYALKQLPFGKNILFAMCLLPISLQQCMSFSYDAVINPIAFTVIAVSMKFAFDKEEIKKHNYISFAICSILLMQCKGGAYIPLILLILIPLLKNKKTDKTYFKKLLILLMTTFVGFVLFKVVYSMLFTVEDYGTDAGNIISWAGAKGYSISYLLEKPLRIIKVLGSTIFEKFDFYLQSLIGGGLGWFTIEIPWFIVLIMFTLVILTTLKVESEKTYTTKTNRIFMILIGLMCFGMCCGGMLLNWTPITMEAIEGVQGRYFIPFILAIFLAFKNDSIQIKHNIDRYAIFYLIMIQPIVIYFIEYYALCS